MPIMILGLLLLGILIDSLTTNSKKWNDPDNGGVWISRLNNFMKILKMVTFISNVIISS